MGHGPRRSTRRLLLGGLAAVAVVAGTAIPATAVFAANDYPVPPPPVVEPTSVTRPTGPPAEVKGTTVTKNTNKPNNGVEVLGAQVTRGSMPFTGGDVAGLAAIGVGAVAIGAVMVQRTRRSKATA